MDKTKFDIKLKRYINRVTKEILPKKIILFGSYARGNFTENSDIDIAVVVDEIEGDFLDAEFRLFKLRRDIDDRIEPVLLEEKKDRSGFLESILNYGKVIYSC
jgi:uncharacterized protein